MWSLSWMLIGSYWLVQKSKGSLFQNWETSKNRENFSENLVVRPKYLPISLLKSDRFTKNHIYSERGDFGASFYTKNSTSIFFRKMEFFKGGGPLKLGGKNCLLFSANQIAGKFISASLHPRLKVLWGLL